MAFPFPRHEDGSLDFEAYDRLSKELRMEAAFDIRDNYPDDLQALGIHLLTRSAALAAEEAELEAGIEEDEKTAARLNKKADYLENKADHLENKAGYLGNKADHIEKTVLIPAQKRQEELYAQYEYEVKKATQKISGVTPNSSSKNSKPARHKSSICTIL